MHQLVVEAWPDWDGRYANRRRGSRKAEIAEGDPDRQIGEGDVGAPMQTVFSPSSSDQFLRPRTIFSRWRWIQAAALCSFFGPLAFQGKALAARRDAVGQGLPAFLTSDPRSRLGLGKSLLLGVTLSMYSTMTRGIEKGRRRQAEDRNLAQGLMFRGLGSLGPGRLDLEIVVDLLFCQDDANLADVGAGQGIRSASWFFSGCSGVGRL